MLRPGAGRDVYSADRIPAEGDLARVVDGFWSVRWRRPGGMPIRQQVLSDPVVHLTVERTGPPGPDGRPPLLHGHPMPAALAHGPVTRLFEVDLPEEGCTTGVRFRPGGWAVLFDVDASGLADRVVPAARAGVELGTVLPEVLAEESLEQRWALLRAWLTARLDQEAARIDDDAAFRAVGEAIELMRDREHLRLQPIAEAVHCSERTLQRWFARYVGVAPLRVLRRYRLQDATAALEAGERDLAGLAAELGWADQAHFTREFTTVIGVSPDRYRRT